jgi:lipopolysaccharide transport protein LptA
MIYVSLCFFLLSSLCLASSVNIKSDAFELDGTKEIVTAQGNVVVDQGELQLKSDTVLYEKKNKQLHLSGGVLITKPDIKISCNTATADNVANSITAEGAVTFRFVDLEGKTGEIYFDVSDNIVTLKGNVQATQRGSFLSADQITVDLTQNKIITQGDARVKLSLEEL